MRVESNRQGISHQREWNRKTRQDRQNVDKKWWTRSSWLLIIHPTFFKFVILTCYSFWYVTECNGRFSRIFEIFCPRLVLGERIVVWVVPKVKIGLQNQLCRSYCQQLTNSFFLGFFLGSFSFFLGTQLKSMSTLLFVVLGTLEKFLPSLYSNCQVRRFSKFGRNLSWRQ